MSNFVVLEPEKKIKSFFYLSFVSRLGKCEPFSLIYQDSAATKTEVKADIAHGSIELIILNCFPWILLVSMQGWIVHGLISERNLGT